MKKIKIFSPLVTFAIVIAFFLNGNVLAQESCLSTESQNGYSALLNVDSGSYGVYIQSEKPGNYRMTEQDLESGECQELFNGASSARWNSIGEITSGLSGNKLLSVTYGGSEENINPQLILYPEDALICDPTNCSLEYEGLDYQLLPTTVSYDIDTLKVGLIKSVNDINPPKVKYFLDKKPLYESKSLELDERYVGPDVHEVTQRLYFTDGSVMQRRFSVEKDFSLASFIYPYIMKNLPALKLLFFSISLMLIMYIFQTIFRAISARRKWKINHGLIIKKTVAKANTPESNIRNEKVTSTKRWFRDLGLVVGVPIIIIVIVGIVNSNVIGRFTVDGVSMETTLHDGDTHWLNRWPATFAKINQRDFLPNRGDVVVINRPEKSFFEDDLEQSTSYVVKRIIGLPGDRVYTDRGYLVVDATDFDEPLNVDIDKVWSSVLEPIYNTVDITLGPGQIYVVGDNRIDSIDSRIYGPLEASQVEGRVLFTQKEGLVPYIEPF